MIRKIIHIDMDCFYAAVEIRDNSDLQGQPVAVGGAANKRGVLTTCNYQARQFGLHSAMPTAKALALCPQVILLPVAMDKYRQVSQQIHKIFKQYTDIIEPLSLDEAYLDVTYSTAYQGSATLLAQAIRNDIERQQRLTASAGIAPNKFLAKVASDWNKPNGQFVIAPNQIAAFMQRLPVEKIPGVGKVTAKKLHAKGATTCGKLQQYSKQQLIAGFGKFGDRLYGYCRGIDDCQVQSSRVRKSVSVETTFLDDLTSLTECEQQLPVLYKKLLGRLKNHRDKRIHKHFIKIKFADFSQTTKECVMTVLQLETFTLLLRQLLSGSHQAIRLLGIGVRFRDNDVLSVQHVLAL